MAQSTRVSSGLVSRTSNRQRDMTDRPQVSPPSQIGSDRVLKSTGTMSSPPSSMRILVSTLMPYGLVSIFVSMIYHKKHTDDNQDMNEASNFCPWPCSDPFGYAAANGFPPYPPEARPNAGYPIPGFPADFQPGSATRKVKRQSNSTGTHLGLPGRNLIDPPYTINNDAGSPSRKRLGYVRYPQSLWHYDVHCQ
jgi:hypothetical protein